jgi:predicted metal-dependent phosphoesterase TrpH
VTTRQGHVLALWVEENPPSFRRVESTLEMIHSQGGLAAAPHPMSWLTRSLSARTLDRLWMRDEPGVVFDAIETANPSPAGRLTRGRTIAANDERWGLPGLGSSDAHHLQHIGTGWTEFEGTTADDLRSAILAGETRPGMRAYPSHREIGVAQIGAGLAWGYLATPRKMLSRRRR